MSAPRFALVLGLVLAAAGMVGFIPAATRDGVLFGWMPVNGLVNAVHVVLGFWGLFAWSGAVSAVNFCRGAALVLALLAAIEASAGNPAGWAHGAIALLAAYFGLRSLARGSAERRAERRHGTGDRRTSARPVAFERRRGAFDRRQAGYGGGTLAAG